MTSPYLTVAETAERLRVNEKTIRRWIRDGSLPAIRVGSTIRIPSERIDRLAGDAS